MGRTALRGVLLFAPEFGDCARDGIVKASVQRAEVLGAHRRVFFNGQVGDRLAHVPVIVDDLRDREPLTEQLLTVKNRAGPNLGA